MGKKAIVTGGAGFIGSHLVDFLLKKNFEVLVLDNLFSGNIENVNKKGLFKKIDICNQNKLLQIFLDFKPKFVFHLAGASLENCRRVNVLGTRNIVNACITSKVKKFIFTSSVAIYGNTNQPIKENDVKNPLNLYGKSKINAEEIIKNYPNYSVLRLANVYGPRQRCDTSGGVIPIFCSRILKGKYLPVFGDGRQKRDFVYISDVIEAIYKSATINKNLILNISSGIGINLSNLIRTIEKVSDQKAKLKYFPTRKNDIDISLIDSKLAQKILDWKPKTDLFQGIRNTLEYVS